MSGTSDRNLCNAEDPALNKELLDTNALGQAFSRRLLTEAGVYTVCTSSSTGLIHTLAAIKDIEEEPVRFSFCEEFLAPQEHKCLLSFVMGRETGFRPSMVISSSTQDSVLNPNHRRSRVLFELDQYENLFRDRIRSFFPRILASLRIPTFPITRIEVQLTASNDGDYFRTHNDNTHSSLITRQITYVYYFYKEPAAFTGGALRLYASRFQDGRYSAGASSEAIIPKQNFIVFFPSHLMHEVERVYCHSGAFIDSRFTVNGWIHN